MNVLASPPSFMAALGAKLLDGGWPILPVMPGAKAPGRFQAGAWAPYPGWPKHCDRPTTPLEIEVWSRWPGCGIGFACGHVMPIDLDIVDGDLAHRAVATTEATLGPTPLLRIGRAPKRLLVYRCATPVRGRSVGPIQVLGHGQQFVGFGIHPVTGRPYEWPEESPLDVPFDRVPLVTDEAVAAFLEAVRSILPEDMRPKTLASAAGAALAAADAWRGPSDPRGTREAVEAALAYLPNNNLPGSEWIGIGCAIKAALGEDGRDLWIEWSRQAAKSGGSGRPDTPERRWESLRPHSIGAGSIYRLAMDRGWRPDPDLVLNGTAADLAAQPHAAGAMLAALPAATSLAAEPAGGATAQLEADPGLNAAKPTPEARPGPLADIVVPAADTSMNQQPPPHPARLFPPNGPDSWEEPLDFLADDTMTGPPVLRPDHVPAALWGFASDLAARTGADPAAAALAAIVAAASVIPEAWSVQPKRFDTSWKEQARLWGAIVGDPSTLKTPLLRAATAPIDLLEAQSRDEHAAAMRVWKNECVAAKLEKSPEPPRPRLARRIVEGTTVEALAEVLRGGDDASFTTPAGKVLVRADELEEWAASMDRYAAGGRGGGDRGAWLRAWNGGAYSVDRVKRGSFMVPSWSVCLLGGIQPGPVQRIARDASDDGLLQRFAFVVPGPQRDGADRAPDAAALARYAAIFPALAAMHPPAAFPGAAPRAVVFHADAHQHREEAMRLAKAVGGAPDASKWLKSALGKWPGMFARTALTFHLIELADAHARGIEAPRVDVIREDTARRTTAWMRDVALPHLLRAEALFFCTVQTGHARWIAGYILASDQVRARRRVAARDIRNSYAPLRAPEHMRELAEVMASLESMGWVRAEPPPGRGRDPAAWQVNPRLHDVFAVAAEAERIRRKEAQAAVAEAIRRTRGGAS